MDAIQLANESEAWAVGGYGTSTSPESIVRVDDLGNKISFFRMCTKSRAINDFNCASDPLESYGDSQLVPVDALELAEEDTIYTLSYEVEISNMASGYGESDIIRWTLYVCTESGDTMAAGVCYINGNSLDIQTYVSGSLESSSPFVSAYVLITYSLQSGSSGYTPTYVGNYKVDDSNSGTFTKSFNSVSSTNTYELISSSDVSAKGTSLTYILVTIEGFTQS